MFGFYNKKKLMGGVCSSTDCVSAPARRRAETTRSIFAECKGERTAKKAKNRFSREEAGTIGRMTATPYKWKDSKGKEYPIFLSASGSAFVNKVSAKTGKEYRNYLGEQMSREICAEMHVEYKGKKGK